MTWLEGWFGSPAQPDTASRQGRQKCWDSRDAYFTCLDNTQVLKPGDEGKACSSEKSGYERNCAKSWIEYFNKRRVLAEQQKNVLKQMNNQSKESNPR